MKQILWFRRDLRIEDNAILHHASGEVLPLFIFDKNILNDLPKNDKRITFIYESVLKFKESLRKVGLDLAIFYDEPKKVFEFLKNDYDEVLCSCDFDSYAIKRDNEIEQILPMQRFYDSFLMHPKDVLKKDGMPYKVFTPFYKSLNWILQSDSLEEFIRNKNLKLSPFHYEEVPTLNTLGFSLEKLPDFLYECGFEILDSFQTKLDSYKADRDYFYKDATSKLSVHLRFGLISPKQIFNSVKKLNHAEPFIRELFWREFYNYILYHFPYSEHQNFNQQKIQWNHNKKKFDLWCSGKTGIPIVDAAMIHLNNTGTMHNRLRMIVASFLTKNLLIPWQWGEQYFALKLLDYELSSNVGSWQWGASTGADAAPYFRVFNPYTQSEKFDKEGVFIKSVLPQLKNCEAKLLHKENGVQNDLFINYPNTIINIKQSRLEAIERFKNAKF